LAAFAAAKTGLRLEFRLKKLKETTDRPS